MKDRIDDVEDRLEVGEIFVRGFMALGALIWTVAAIGAYLGGRPGVFYAYGVVAILTVAAFLVGEFHQFAGAALLGAGAAALVVWGVVAGWEVGIWVMMGATLIVPTMLAAGLFLFEEREEKVIERVERTQPTRIIHA